MASIPTTRTWSRRCGADRRRRGRRARPWSPTRARRIPVISISGTNGKSTVTRMIAHVLGRAGRRVGFTTSDGIAVDGRMIEPGDWTGPGGAAAILGRSDVEVAVLETARGGILLKGVGYASNEASVLTNVSADHLDLQGIHTLPELAAAKATICRITKPDGWVVLNADDRHVAAVADLVRARRGATSRSTPTASPSLRAHVERGGRAYVVRRGALVELEAGETRPIVDVDEIPAALGGLARHNVANALAAAGGARAMGATLEEVAAGLRDFRPSADRSPGRLNLFRHGKRVVIVDFAHNEAGLEALLDVADGIAGGRRGPRPGRSPRSSAPPATGRTTRSAGSGGSPGARAGGSSSRRRSPTSAVATAPRWWRCCATGSPRARREAARRLPGRRALDAAAVPVHETEVAALRAELALGRRRRRPRPPGPAGRHRPHVPRRARRRLPAAGRSRRAPGRLPGRAAGARPAADGAAAPGADGRARHPELGRRAGAPGAGRALRAAGAATGCRAGARHPPRTWTIVAMWNAKGVPVS